MNLVEWAKRTHRRRFRRQPAIMISLDEPVILNGFRPIAGWAVGRFAPIRLVEAIVQGRVIASGPPTECRPDVAKVFPRFRFRGLIGFRHETQPGVLSDGRYPLTLRAHDERGRTAELDTTLIVQRCFPEEATLPAHIRGTDREYQCWLRRRASAQIEEEPLALGPRMSVILSANDNDASQVSAEESIASLRQQSYSRWELIIGHGASKGALAKWLEKIAQTDERIRLTGDVAAAPRGEYVTFVESGDRLSANALAAVVRATQGENNKEAPDIIYADEDCIDDNGFRVQPFFKPDWSPDLLRSMPYLGWLVVCRSRLPGGTRLSSGRRDLLGVAMRTAERDGLSANVRHIPQVLYHRRIGASRSARA